MDFSDHAGQAEMLLISDFPLETEHIELIHRLCDKPITPDEIQFSGDRRSCTWPLRLELSYGKIHSGGNNIWHCAMFLVRNREVVSAIHSLGCNLELILKTVELQEPLSLSAGTMKQLAELEINLTIRG